MSRSLNTSQGTVITLGSPRMQIFAPTFHSQMETYRRMAQVRYGSKYPTKVAPWKSMLVAHCKKTKKGPEDTAREFIGILKGHGRWNNHLSAVIFSACLDIMDEKLV